MTLIEIFNNIADAIRNKLSDNNKIIPANMPTSIDKIIDGSNGSYKLNITTFPNAIVTFTYYKSGDAVTQKTTTANSSGIATIYFNNSDSKGIYEIKINDGDNVYYTSYNFSLTLTESLNYKYNGVEKYNGSINSLSENKERLSAASVGSYALFAGGGIYNNTAYATVDTYNNTLSKSTATDLSVARYGLCSANINNYCLFGGGSSVNYSSKNTVDSYNSSLVKGTPIELNTGVYDGAATNVGVYAIFAGGFSGSSSPSNSIATYNSSLSKGIADALSVARGNLAATSNSKYALFAGGGEKTVNYGGTTNIVDSYSTSLAHSTAKNLRYNISMLSGIQFKNYALFAGGMSVEDNSISGSDTIRIITGYNTSLTESLISNLDRSRYDLAIAVIGSYAIFGGGENYSNGSVTDVDVLDGDFTHYKGIPFRYRKYHLAATSVGNYAIFAGGLITEKGFTTRTDTLDIYTNKLVI